MSKQKIEDLLCGAVEFVAVYREPHDETDSICGAGGLPGLKLIADALYGAFEDGSIRINHLNPDLEDSYDFLIVCARSDDDFPLTLSASKCLHSDDIRHALVQAMRIGLCID